MEHILFVEPARLLGQPVIGPQANVVGDDLVEVDDRRLFEQQSELEPGTCGRGQLTFDEEGLLILDKDGMTNYGSVECGDDDIDEMRKSYRKKFSLNELFD